MRGLISVRTFLGLVWFATLIATGSVCAQDNSAVGVVEVSRLGGTSYSAPSFVQPRTYNETTTPDSKSDAEWITALLGGGAVLAVLVLVALGSESEPHPATSIVEAAVTEATPIEGPALARAMLEAPTTSDMPLRTEQAKELTRKLSEHTLEISVEAERFRAKARREIEYLRAHDALADAAIEHERAMAALEVLRNRRARGRSAGGDHASWEEWEV